jgi:F-type H+-transporting ATPase subunit delta
MTTRAAIARYARALFEVAERQGDPDRVADELGAIGTAMTGDSEVQRVLAGPAVAPARKVDAVRLLAERLGLSDTTGKLLTVLAGRDELDILPDFAAAFRARLLARRNIVPAEVTTARPLPADRVEALARRLGEVTGKQIQLETRVDPAIIGGVVTRIGSLVYDGSIVGQLARLRQKLVENA